jgi:diacylglycerol kinase (ATP)
MASPPESLARPVNPQKLRTGFARLWHATGYSVAGLRAGWGEAAFRLEACLAFLLVPLAFWIGRTWTEVALLAGTVLLLMIVELLNTAIEAAIDRIGPEWHDLSKRSKDMGSAAVFLATLLAGGIWAAGLWHYFFP